MKPWMSNLIFVSIEVLLVFFTFVIGKNAINCALNGDFVGYLNELENMINYVHAVGIAFVVISILFIVIKQLRTKLTCFLSICNIIWFIAQMYFMYF